MKILRSVEVAAFLSAALVFCGVSHHKARAASYSCEGQAIPNSGRLIGVCTKTVGSFSGVCGRPVYPYSDWQDVVWYVTPWEKSSITIISAHATIVLTGGSPGDRFLGFMIGNSYSPDPVVPYTYTWGKGTDLLTISDGFTFPAGYGMLFPPPSTPAQIKARGWPADYHIDLHLVCTAGINYQGYVVVDYVVNPPGASTIREATKGSATQTPPPAARTAATVSSAASSGARPPVHMIYKSIGTVAAIMPPSNPLPDQGASFLGIRVAPLHAPATLRFRVTANAYADQANEVVLAIFRSGQRPALKVATKPVAANGRVYFNESFDLPDVPADGVGVDVRMGVAKPGSVVINGPSAGAPHVGVPFPTLDVTEAGSP